jgi:cytochrome c556
MSRRTWMMTAAALLSMVAVGCASMQKMKPEEAIDARQKLMKSQGEAWKSIQDKTKAGDIAGVVPEAQKLVETSDKIPTLFPEGSLGPTKTAAKPEI